MTSGVTPQPLRRHRATGTMFVHQVPLVPKWLSSARTLPVSGGGRWRPPRPDRVWRSVLISHQAHTPVGRTPAGSDTVPSELAIASPTSGSSVPSSRTSTASNLTSLVKHAFQLVSTLSRMSCATVLPLRFPAGVSTCSRIVNVLRNSVPAATRLFFSVTRQSLSGIGSDHSGAFGALSTPPSRVETPPPPPPQPGSRAPAP